MVQFINVPRQPSFKETLGSSIGTGLGQGILKASDFASEVVKNRMEKGRLKDLLVAQGVPQQEADLYSALTTGGQTEFAKALLEQKKRGGAFGESVTRPATKLLEAREEGELTPEQETEEELSGAIQEQDVGLTPAERVRRQSERFKAGLPIYKEAGTKLRGFARDKERLDLLESLNKTGKLPKGLGRVNVDKEGNLKFPFASSSEAQRYVKILNEFSSGAKDTFGSRVTNFDLSQFLKRFPTLLNTEEGRKQLFQQMKIVNDINSAYYKSLKDVFDKAGGVRNIDPDLAEALAEKMAAPKVERLVKKFDQIGQFSSLPNPEEFQGKKIRNKETGEVLISDGAQWVPQG